MSERMVPYHCPYCGDEDLRPHVPDEGTGHGQWECRSCLRAFSVKFLGLLRPVPHGSDAGSDSTSEAGS